MKGGIHIEAVRNINGKRVCDISFDRRTIVIKDKDFFTKITVNPDGTLRVENFSKEP